ncbi:hypothetical protein BON69_07010 [Escherichia coli]|nr:hypothetical protein BE963_13765 [Escherichia coli]OOH71095.1 hypothetical protein BMU01_10290 [Escherichia coli]TEZ36616.1 hypothetical protein BON69_07010 [Escherichia coli]
MPDTAYGSAQTCRSDKTRQASHQALCANCRMRRERLIRPTVRHRPVGMIRRVSVASGIVRQLPDAA